MPTLLECLNYASCRHLWTVAKAHYLPAPQRHPPKSAWINTLHRHLSSLETLDQLCAGLGPVEQDALRALLEAPEPILQRAFFTRFGAVRPYRPWDKSAPLPDQPWHFPANPTERLWYLGLIYLAPQPRRSDPPRLCIPDEFRQPLSTWLSGLKPMGLQLTPTATVLLPVELLDTLHDLAILLGLLQHFDVTPLHGRKTSPPAPPRHGESPPFPGREGSQRLGWLPPRFLVRLNTHLVHPSVGLGPSSSRLSHPLRRFLPGAGE